MIESRESSFVVSVCTHGIRGIRLDKTDENQRDSPQKKQEQIAPQNFGRTLCDGQLGKSRLIVIRTSRSRLGSAFHALDEGCAATLPTEPEVLVCCLFCPRVATRFLELNMTALTSSQPAYST